jgi:hypothetical protein
MVAIQVKIKEHSTYHNTLSNSPLPVRIIILSAQSRVYLRHTEKTSCRRRRHSRIRRKSVRNGSNKRFLVLFIFRNCNKMWVVFSYSVRLFWQHCLTCSSNNRR